MSRYVDLNGVSWDGKPISSKIQEVQTKHGYMQGITIGWLWGDNVPHIDLEEHDKQVIEQYKADTNLKDTIREIHDNVAQEMYCKGIDDFLSEICKMIVQSENNGNYRFYAVEIKQSIADLAEQLKAGGENV